jgi:hypothetical protein
VAESVEVIPLVAAVAEVTCIKYKKLN